MDADEEVAVEDIKIGCLEMLQLAATRNPTSLLIILRTEAGEDLLVENLSDEAMLYDLYQAKRFVLDRIKAQDECDECNECNECDECEDESEGDQ